MNGQRFSRPEPDFWLNEPSRRWPLADGPPPDPFELRGLLWCDRCQQEMTPFVEDEIRYYRCGCREPVCAPEVERQVWNRFQEANEVYAAGVHPNQRRSAIRRMVSRIRLRASPTQLRFDWRD